MIVHVNGARFYGGQIDRIEQGFRAIGHEITPYPHDAELVYSNNDHAQLTRDKAAGALKGKLILTCLDVPTHLGPACDTRGMAAQLSVADAVCTISRFGQWQVKQYLNLESTVIYNPIKPVNRRPGLRRTPFYRFAHIGRRFDINKRFTLGASALQIAGHTSRDLCLVGGETGWGDYLGVLNDDNLNVVLNSVDFVLCTSRVEGLCLPVLEAMAAGAIPIVCNDMTTRTELLPPELFSEYEVVNANAVSIARFISWYADEESGERLTAMKARLHQHYLDSWAVRVSPAGVAQAILDVYAGLR